MPIILRVCPLLAALLIGGCGDDAPNRTPSGTTTETEVSRTAIEQSLRAAESYLQAGDFPRAEAILLRLIERAPREAAAHEMHGQVLLGRAADLRDAGDHDQSQELLRMAYERYRAVIEYSPASAGLHQSAGDVAQMAGLENEALAHYNVALRLDAAQTRASIMAGQLLTQLERYDEAEDVLGRARAIDPDEPLIHVSLANLAVQRERFDTALEHIREARTIRPDELSFRVVEAMIHRKAGDPQRGLELLLGLSRHQRAQPSVAQEIAACRALLESSM